MPISFLHSNWTRTRTRHVPAEDLIAPEFIVLQAKGKKTQEESSVVEFFFLRRGMWKMEEHVRRRNTKIWKGVR